ncbi:MAG: alpha/beta hydrolase, partial [Gemmataceae bacterium]|nr:alpha/beta hydrolase [Gemmataceae bacterium]
MLRSFLRRLRRWAVLLLLTYVGIVVMFWFLERRLVFLPASAEESWVKPEDPRTQEVQFHATDGNAIAGRWIPPETPQHGAVLVCYGNGGNLTHRGKLAADFRAALGAGVLLFDYPGYGKSAGTPSEDGCYAAGAAAYKWLVEEQKLAPGRVILCGESLGGGTAVELATRHEHRALVLIYTFTSLPAAARFHYPFLPTHTFMRTRFDNLAKIGRCPRPVFFVHGTADRVVPFRHSEELFAAANEPKEFVRVEGFGHAALPGEVVFPRLTAFLAAHA